MDANAGYWSSHFDEASQEITTFRTPFGRYCYSRLPFGLCVSVLRPIPTGHGPNHSKSTRLCRYRGRRSRVRARQRRTRQDHVAMQVAKEEGLVFNSKKCAIKTSEVVFFGHVDGNNDIKPDPSKIEYLITRCVHNKTRKISNRSSVYELFGGIDTALRRQGVTVARSPQ